MACQSTRVLVELGPIRPQRTILRFSPQHSAMARMAGPKSVESAAARRPHGAQGEPQARVTGGLKAGSSPKGQQHGVDPFVQVTIILGMGQTASPELLKPSCHFSQACDCATASDPWGPSTLNSGAQAAEPEPSAFNPTVGLQLQQNRNLEPFEPESQGCLKAWSCGLALAVRTMIIWGFGLFIHYKVDPESPFGEEWTPSSRLQLCGFFVLITGQAIYGEILRLPGLRQGCYGCYEYTALLCSLTL